MMLRERTASAAVSSTSGLLLIRPVQANHESLDDMNTHLVHLLYVTRQMKNHFIRNSTRLPLETPICMQNQKPRETK